MSSYQQEFYDIFGPDFEEFRLSIEKDLENSDESLEEKCQHLHVEATDDKTICHDCGQETMLISYNQEWRYYGNSDNRNTHDPSRCHSRSDSTRGIESVTAALNIPQPVKAIAREHYMKIVGDATTRGTTRASIVAACIFYAYRKYGDTRTAEEVRKMFNINKKNMSNGLTRYLSVFREDRDLPNRPSNLIRRTMVLAGIDESHYLPIKRLVDMLDGTSRNMSHSCPQSVTSSIVYLYLCINEDLRKRLDLSKTTFARKVDLSDITISKHVREAYEILRAYKYPKIERARNSVKKRRSTPKRPKEDIAELDRPTADNEELVIETTLHTGLSQSSTALRRIAKERKERKSQK